MPIQYISWLKCLNSESYRSKPWTGIGQIQKASQPILKTLTTQIWVRIDGLTKQRTTIPGSGF